jgi:hypothetical protein
MTVPTIPDRLATLQPKMLRAGLRTEAKGDRKKLADLRPEIGRLVERALELMGLTKQEAAYRLQYADAGAISRWCSATERPLFDKLFTLEGFDIAYVRAIAERNPAIDVDTVITIRRIA